MRKAVIEQLTNVHEVRSLRYHYKAIQDFYETLYNGPRNAVVEGEYLVIRDAVIALYRREVELLVDDFPSSQP